MNGLKYFLFIILILSSNLLCQSINELIPKGEAFYIQSAQEYGKSDKGYWDIPGGEENIREKAQIKIWQLGDAQKDRRYVIENSTIPGYVKIHIEGVAGYLDIECGNNDNGAKLIIYGPHTGWNQNYLFKYMGNGKFKIFSQNGKVICLSGRSSENGTALNMWDDHNGAWMEWVLISTKTKKPLLLDEKIKELAGSKSENMNGIRPVYIQSATCYGKNEKGYFDVPGNSEPKSGNNIQTWALDFGPDRKYEIFPSSSSIGYYNISIAGNNKLLVDVSGGVDKNGTSIGLYELNNTISQNYSFKHLGNGRFKIIAQNGKVVCISRDNWENGSNVAIWQDHDGPWMEWYLIDVETNKPFIPGNSNINTTSITINSKDNEVKSVSSEIDNLYNSINDIESQSSKILSGLKNSNTIISKSYNITNTVNKLTSRVNDTEAALEPFGKFPVIGVPVKVLSTSLKSSLSQIGKANTVLQAMRVPVLDKSNDNVNYAVIKNIVFNSQLNYLKGYLFDAKKNMADLVSKNDLTGIAAIKQKLTNITSSLGSVDNSLAEIEKTNDKMKKMENPMNEFDNGLNKFDKGFSKVDKVADEINKVLNKRFKKKILKVGIDISLRDILGGGKVGKIFDKYINGFIQGAFKPLLSKLNIKIPGFPDAGKLKNTLNENLDYTKNIRENSEAIEKATTGINGAGI